MMYEYVYYTHQCLFFLLFLDRKVKQLKVYYKTYPKLFFATQMLSDENINKINIEFS